MSMLKKMCSTLPCRNAHVTSRYHWSPWAIGGAARAPRKKISLNGCVKLPDWTTCARKTRTLIPISAFVTMKSVPTLVYERALTAAFFAPVGCPAHSGHLIPTDANTMQSVQIGRPQFEHVIAVSFDGC